MRNNLKNLIRDLSEIYDSISNDTFVSIFLNKNKDKSFLKKRIDICTSILNKDEQDNFKKTIEDINEFLKKNIWDNIAIFASHKHNFFKYITLQLELNNSLIVDSSPYIRPLTQILDEFKPFTLLLINSNHAKIFSIYLGQIKETKNISYDIINKHKKGGWSQARFQRIRKGAIHSFFLEVAEMLEKIASEQIILAGPGLSKIQFKEMLPKHLQYKIIDVVNFDLDDENKILKDSIYLISEKEKEHSRQTVKNLKEEILKDGLAVYGLDDTLQAVKNGQVELLIVEKDYKIKGCICENCQIIKTSSIKSCPICGKHVSEVDVIEEIIELAERTDAEIEFTDNEEISKLGHIGGILRYKL